MKKITVSELIRDKGEELGIEILAGTRGTKRIITEPHITRPSLFLAGYEKDFPEKRIQLLGRREIGFLQEAGEKRRERLDSLTTRKIPCIIISCGLSPPPELVEFCTQRNVPLLRSSLPTADVVRGLFFYLEDKLAPEVIVHGTLVDVYGIGILFTGESGIGKSETALDLVARGHRLVADDTVRIKRKGSILIGEGTAKTELLRHHMEIRGIGIVDIASMYGIRAIRLHKRVEMEVKLIRWDPQKDYTRTGLETEHTNILGIEIPYVEIPLVPGKNIAVLVEVVALNHMLKLLGYDAARVFEHELIRVMKEEAKRYAKLEEDTE
ncbi:HPr(Ser) kinase/phosphatase [bacterium]|nr:MAG: HPr(Ser) kinase/phosphatase [bacterium]